MDSFEDAWKVIDGYCKSKITDIAYNTWISRIQPIDLDFENGTAYLLVPNDFHAQTLRRCYMKLLNEGFREIFGTEFNIEFRTPANVTNNPKPPAAATITTSASTAPLCRVLKTFHMNTPLTHLLSARQTSSLTQRVLLLRQIRHTHTILFFFTEIQDSEKLTFCMLSAMKLKRTIRQK